MVKLVELGSLGIGALRLYKEALLAKWLWRFFMGFSCLWPKIIVSLTFWIEFNIWDWIQRHPSHVLLPQWCITTRGN